jgi:hypothetical protein
LYRKKQNTVTCLHGENLLASKDTFDIILLIARPAAGKSEIIDYLKRTPIEERMQRFHIGEIEEIDDFPMLWRWFEEDELLSQMGYPRLYSDEDGYFLDDHLWILLIKLICLDYQKKIRANPTYHQDYTTIIEFSRGKEHGGYQTAFQHLDKEMLPRMAILYVNVSWEESRRKNRKRFNPDRPGSILEHSLPDAKLEKLYRYSDWDELTSGNSEFLHVQGIGVPYMVFENEDDVTTDRSETLGNRLESTLQALWDIYTKSSK